MGQDYNYRLIAISLYRKLMKEGNNFFDKVGREYIKYRVRAEFKKNCDIKSVKAITRCINRGKIELDKLQAANNDKHKELLEILRFAYGFRGKIQLPIKHRLEELKSKSASNLCIKFSYGERYISLQGEAYQIPLELTEMIISNLETVSERKKAVYEVLFGLTPIIPYFPQVFKVEIPPLHLQNRLNKTLKFGGIDWENLPKHIPLWALCDVEKLDEIVKKVEQSNIEDIHELEFNTIF